MSQENGDYTQKIPYTLESDSLSELFNLFLIDPPAQRDSQMTLSAFCCIKQQQQALGNFLL